METTACSKTSVNANNHLRYSIRALQFSDSYSDITAQLPNLFFCKHAGTDWRASRVYLSSNPICRWATQRYSQAGSRARAGESSALGKCCSYQISHVQQRSPADVMELDWCVEISHSLMQTFSLCFPSPSLSPSLLLFHTHTTEDLFTTQQTNMFTSLSLG